MTASIIVGSTRVTRVTSFEPYDPYETTITCERIICDAVPHASATLYLAPDDYDKYTWVLVAADGSDAGRYHSYNLHEAKAACELHIATLAVMAETLDADDILAIVHEELRKR